MVMNMETSLYDAEVDASQRQAQKRPMTLDFHPSSKKQKMSTALLASPDLNLLKLASPELERMIISQNGMITTTPTPTTFMCPKNVTEEQEAYARGFVDALNELHKKEGSQVGSDDNASSDESQIGSSVPVVFASGVGIQLAEPVPEYTTLTTVTSLPQSSNVVSSVKGQTVVTMMQAPGNQLVYTSASPAPAMTQGQGTIPSMHIKEEPQMVPSVEDFTPPLSPINMVHQESIKLERKRERNRVAARKCRTRKLERISRLEDRVSELKGQNSDLTKTASDLRAQVAKLKTKIMEHVQSGCQVMISQNLL